MSSVLLKEVHGNICKLLFNNAKRFNSIDWELGSALWQEIQEAESLRQKIVFFSTLEKVFQSGGNLFYMLENCKDVAKFGDLFYGSVKTLFNYPYETLSILRGHTIGYGVGLSMSCDYLVSLPSTLWSMPEHLIGSVPNTGTSYFLSHIEDDAYGLYLFLTNKRISGEDCYFSGITSHYMESERLSDFWTDLNTADSIKDSIEKFASIPSIEKSRYLRHKDEINEAFKNPSSIEEIIEKLHKIKTDFAKETLNDIKASCPLTLKIALKQFKNGKNMPFLDAIDLEAVIDCNILYHKNDNFRIGVTHKMRDKSNGIAPWNPKTLEEVTEEMVDYYFIDHNDD